MTTRRILPFALPLIAALAIASECSRAHGDILFSEDFDGYTSFPSQIPSGDFVNPGLPLQSEGADEYWYGGRFESGGGTIDSDLAVQKIGGGSNSTRTGRVEDDAGILFNISTVGLDSASLSFDWRTFLAETGDRLKVGYYVGTLNFGSDRYEDFYANFGSSWWSNNWTQLLSASASNSWHSEVFALPLGQPSVWVAFWLDNGEGDYGKIDSIVVQGTHPIPEPSSFVIAGMGIALCGVMAWRRRRGARS
ncbi:MAG: PEP-CTERM sorting domain-containing protein [Pirellulales bacterium]